MITGLRIAGYRSARSLSLPLGNLTVILGENGTGKTNIYRALELIQRAACGDLAASLAAEGGMPSALWAGGPWRTEEERAQFATDRRGKARIELGVDVDHLSYKLSVGLPNGVSEPALPLDPVVREEGITARAGGRKTVMMERKGPAVRQRNQEGRFETVQTDLLMSETALAAPIVPDGTAETALMQTELRRWRFYHQFRTDPASPLRQPHMAICAPELASDGSNWTAVLMTVAELGDDTDLNAGVAAAFPGASLSVRSEGSRAEAELHTAEFQRPFGMTELSDGTLRYLCLVAALTAYRLPPFIALNEPETSLHPSVIPPLAQLIGRAAEETQVMVVTHSRELAEILDLDYAATLLRLEKDRGETRLMD